MTIRSQDTPGRLLVVTCDFGGGTGQHLSGMVRRWMKSGWHVEVICQGRVETEMAKGVSLTRGPRPSVIHHFPVAQARNFRQLKQRISTFRPDVLHCYFFWSIILGRLLKRSGAIAHLVENREDQGFNWGKPQYAVLRRSAHIPDRVICVSDAVQRVVVERENLDPSRVIVVRNGIERTAPATARATARRDLGLGESDPVVGMVANLNRPVKGVEYFIDAMPRILEEVPATRFVIFGNGMLRERLEQQAGALAVRNRVLFAGFRKDVSRFYPAFDVSVLTSLSEGLSITLLESMQHGLPVVVTEVGGNGEVVVEGVTGFLVPPRVVEPFARRVVQLLADSNLRRQMGDAARRVVAERFDADRVAQQYLDLYAQLLGSNPSQG